MTKAESLLKWIRAIEQKRSYCDLAHQLHNCCEHAVFGPPPMDRFSKRALQVAAGEKKPIRGLAGNF